MNENKSKSNKQLKQNKTDVLDHLLDDPTESIRNIAKKMNSYRQKVWREKKKLEDEHVIWGYTAVIDESKLNHVSYMVLMKTKPMSRELADLMAHGLLKGEAHKQNVRLLNLCRVNGEYDWIMRFSAPDHATARRYYDTLRLFYDEYLLEKPVMVDMCFCLVAEGKRNPEIKRLHDFVVD